MAKIISIPISGKVGLQVDMPGRFGQVRRAWVIPSNPNTASQLAVRSRLTTCIAAFEALTRAQQDAWVNAAKTMSTRSRLGMSGPMTGLQLYTKLNTTLLAFGQEAIDTPPGTVVLGAVAPQNLVAAYNGGNPTLKLTCPTSPGENTVLRASAPVTTATRRTPRDGHPRHLPGAGAGQRGHHVALHREVRRSRCGRADLRQRAAHGQRLPEREVGVSRRGSGCLSAAPGALNCHQMVTYLDHAGHKLKRSYRHHLMKIQKPKSEYEKGKLRLALAARYPATPLGRYRVDIYRSRLWLVRSRCPRAPQQPEGLTREQAFYEATTNAVAVVGTVAANLPPPYGTVFKGVVVGCGILMAVWLTNLEKRLKGQINGSAKVDRAPAEGKG